MTAPRFVVGYETRHGRLITTLAKYDTLEKAAEAARRQNLTSSNATEFKSYVLTPVDISEQAADRGGESLWSTFAADLLSPFVGTGPGTGTKTAAWPDWSELTESTRLFWRGMFIQAVRAAYESKDKDKES